MPMTLIRSGSRLVSSMLVAAHRVHAGFVAGRMKDK